jgi:predicted GTPase
MRFGKLLRRYWAEILLFLAIAIPWLSLLALGTVWLWQGGYVWVWATAAAVLGLLVWPLSRFIRHRTNQEVQLALGEAAKPSGGWSVVEQEAWTEVLSIADATAPFAFTELEPLAACARNIVEVVARRFHPEAHTAWAQFNLPEVLLLTERLCRDIRRETLRHVPGVRAIRLSHLLWAHQQNERYGPVARTSWRIGFGLWRIVRGMLNPLQAVGQETSSIFMENAAKVLSYRLRAYATRLLVLEIGRAAIDLYAGRLALSHEEIDAAQAREMAGSVDPPGPVRIVLIGQVNAGKSSLLNALAQEIRSAVGPLPVTSNAEEYLLELEGRPTVMLIDTPGLDERATSASQLRVQAERADLIMWVASATQPARGPDRKLLDDLRGWFGAQLTRRPPPILLALTHIDELRPAAEWMPPYDVTAPAGPKARAIRAAVNAVVGALDLRVDAIVPVAVPPGRESYNIDALWARIAVELDEAKLAQLDRLRIGQQRLNLRELADQVGHVVRTIVQGTVNP